MSKCLDVCSVHDHSLSLRLTEDASSWFVLQSNGAKTDRELGEMGESPRSQKASFLPSSVQDWLTGPASPASPASPVNIATRNPSPPAPLVRPPPPPRRALSGARCPGLPRSAGLQGLPGLPGIWHVMNQPTVQPSSRQAVLPSLDESRRRLGLLGGLLGLAEQTKRTMPAHARAPCSRVRLTMETSDRD
ncbi:hypothetical protein KVR01_004171 [Diaporthe batatas]|uniref:uncharacterized protein n=1 Tax=Diaporthe batatas TaxID=748121 RepID=UPI001D037613|nr:uncharacterized protein KVR01_004171 [Diaporthe batatas]KAG8165619.1 hypothetical protein KVR01_004171 [Diaporthe batatas]